MHADKGGEVPDTQGAPADAEQALTVHMQLLYRLAVPRQRAHALPQLQVPHLQDACQPWQKVPVQQSEMQLQQGCGTASCNGSHMAHVGLQLLTGAVPHLDAQICGG